MRFVLLLAALAAAVVFSGCARTKKPKPVFQPVSTANSATNRITTASTAQNPSIVTLAEALTGKVSSANNDLKFVVLTFPVGQMAHINQKLNIYRAGLKVGELNVTGPQREDSIVADITAGEAKTGDEVRDK